MAPGPRRRPRRNPLSAEEVAEIVALKKRLAHYKLTRFKKNPYYKLLNIFNIACFCVFLEIIACFAGPCSFATHVSKLVETNYGQQYNSAGEAIVSDITMDSEDGAHFVFVVGDFIDVPPVGTEFFIGNDFLLGKELKGSFFVDGPFYRLFAASPILFLCGLALVASLIAFIYNLNQNAYSLSAVSVLNGLVIIAILCY